MSKIKYIDTKLSKMDKAYLDLQEKERVEISKNPPFMIPIKYFKNLKINKL